jgi:hypothetical protein
MAIDPATISSSTISSSGISSSTEYGGESASSSEINKMGYILRDMTMNAVSKFEKLYALPDNVLNGNEKQLIADRFRIDMAAVSVRLAGVHVSTLV